jgi:hypothetical protein
MGAMVAIYDPDRDTPSARPTAWGLRQSIVGQRIEDGLESLVVGTIVSIPLDLHREQKIDGEPVITDPQERTMKIEWEGDIDEFWDTYYDTLNDLYDTYAEETGIEVDTDESDGVVLASGVFA